MNTRDAVAVSDLDLGVGSLRAAAGPVPSQVAEATNMVEKSDAPEYRPWPVRLLGTRDVLDALPSRRSVNAVREAIRDIVEAEGPVHHERLAKLACAAFNLNKVNGERANSVLMALDTSLHRRDADGFVWDDLDRSHGVVPVPNQWSRRRAETRTHQRRGDMQRHGGRCAVVRGDFRQ